MSAEQTYQCSQCGAELPNGLDTPTFPFCSRRCKYVDLGRWFDGKYAIGSPLSPLELEMEMDEMDIEEAELDEG